MTKTDKLNVYLSTVAVMNIKIHNLHWNVIGPQFMVVHKLTEELYKMFQLQFDTVAEIMKMQGGMPMASMQEYLENSAVSEIEAKPYSDMEVIRALDADCDAIIGLAEDIREQADKEDNYLVVNLMEEYLALFAKHSWMIKSMLNCECPDA